ncbi:unnamed protein product, partial [Nesidiocoris tenuis]
MSSPSRERQRYPVWCERNGDAGVRSDPRETDGGGDRPPPSTSRSSARRMRPVEAKRAFAVGLA